MPVRTHKPTSPGRRGLALPYREDVWKGAPEKTLTRGKTRISGRASNGRMTVRHRGGGHKRTLRFVDLRRAEVAERTVERIERDPNRSAYVALTRDKEGKPSYLLAPAGLRAGDRLDTGPGSEIRPGSAMPLSDLPVGSVVHNIEMKPGKGGQMARSAGASAQLLARAGGRAILRLPSGEQRSVPDKCMATLGAVSNADHANRRLAKAGRSRWLGRRPKVRGVAMNPVDHPHGGGEGKSSGGRHPVTPWGVSTKGKRTRTNKATTKYILRDRRARRRKR